jgi:hypothetical protein
MGIDDSTKIVLGSLRNKISPNVDMSSKINLEQTQRENIEFDRTADISLQQVFVEEREKSQIFRPTTKFTLIFKNEYIGSTNYPPYRDNLFYTNAIENAVNATVNTSVPWQGYPQYYEFDFIRNDNNTIGYTQPPNNHINFVNKNASNYNWTHYVSYAFENNPNKQLQAFDNQTTASWTWVASDGIPFIIDVGGNNEERVISFRCVMPHGVQVGEYVKLSINYFGDTLFLVSSLGDAGYGSSEYIFNIDNIGYIGTTFNQGVTGTFKRVIDNENESETISTYYVRRHKILTNSEDAILVKAGFEQNIFTTKVKLEPAVLTPNNLSRTSIRETSQSYTLSFNSDIDISDLIDNQKRPLSELFFTTLWKGYFGWTRPVRQGYGFNIQLSNNNPSSWWDITNGLSSTNLNTGTYFSLFNPQPANPFIFMQDLVSGDTLDGDFCEFNAYQQNERVISNLYHKITYNPLHFSLTGSTNPNNELGYYYRPHKEFTIRVFSDYIEEADATQIVGVPNYAYYSNLSNSFRWRDLYPFGFIDGSGLGVEYPFINGKHYPFVENIFRLIPEGSQSPNEIINTIAEPTVDDCE